MRKTLYIGKLGSNEICLSANWGYAPHELVSFVAPLNVRTTYGKSLKKKNCNVLNGWQSSSYISVFKHFGWGGPQGNIPVAQGTPVHISVQDKEKLLSIMAFV